MLAVPALFATLAAESPTPVPQAAATPAASSRRRDPCGGPQELLKKYLAASPCVFVAGQASLQATYATSSIPADVVLDLGGSTAQVRANRSASGYPGALVNIGISQNAQIMILPPSFSQLSSSTRGTLAAGATDMEFWYKQLVYVDGARGILGGLLLTYEAPTGSPGIAAPGPAYTINPLLNVATNRARSMGVSLAFPVTNFASASSSGITRGWSFAPQAVPFWRSPGGTLLALVVSHDFTTNATPLLLNTAQLITRQFQLQATYGGVNSIVDLANPLAGVTRAQGTSYSRTLTIGGSYMFGTSDL
ncbi:MAG: hypothetical protein WA431_11160 [Candidatus Cybelea sp.]